MRKPLLWIGGLVSAALMAGWVYAFLGAWLRDGAINTATLLPDTRFVAGNIRISIPLWVPSLIVAIPTALLWWLGREGFPPQCCPKCGYDSTGNTSGVCPECGYKLWLYDGLVSEADKGREATPQGGDGSDNVQ